MYAAINVRTYICSHTANMCRSLVLWFSKCGFNVCILYIHVSVRVCVCMRTCMCAYINMYVHVDDINANINVFIYTVEPT